MSNMKKIFIAFCIVAVIVIIMVIRKKNPGRYDDISPAISITAPMSGSSFNVGTSIPVAVSTSDNKEVVKVESLLNGAVKGSSNASPFSHDVDTTGLIEGIYTLTVQAYDAAGNVMNSEGRSIYIAGSGGDSLPPITSVTSPSPDSSFPHGSELPVTAYASDNKDVMRVEFYLDDVMKGTDDTRPYTSVVNTTGLDEGTHTLTTKAYDVAGNVGVSKGVTITLD